MQFQVFYLFFRRIFMLNRVILMGRIVEAPELKTTSGGDSVTTIRVAVERDYKGKDGTRPCDFPTVVAWRQTAEFICRYFGKGSMIAVEGMVQTRTYTTKDGNSRTVTEIVADKATFTGERKDVTSAPQATHQQYAAAPVQQANQQQYAAAPARQANQQQYAAAPAPQATQQTNTEQESLFDDLPF
jgi:single-strand DNA-binding protein